MTHEENYDDLLHEHQTSPQHDHQKGHDHNHAKSAPHKVLIFAIVLTLAFAIVEAIGGWWSNSLALISDAGHMASDAVALAIAAFAAWISTKPPSSKHSYGLGRAEVVGAWISSLMMLGISIAVIIEAVERIHEPMHVKGLPVIVIAFLGMLINILIAWLLARGERTLNIRAALLHVMSDILGSIAALIAGAVIYFTGWFPIDPILSMLISILIMWSALRLIRESLLILMEGVPGHININEVSDNMLTVKGVKDLHDLHIWTLSSGNIALSAHVDINELAGWEPILNDLRELLRQKYGIDHVTLQPEADIMECLPCPEPTVKNKRR